MAETPLPLTTATPTLANAVLVRVPAGFLSPAQDSFDDGRIDLNKVLIRDVTSTFIFQVTGDSMEGCGIYDGDVVTVVVDGDFTIKTLRIHPDRVVLHPENPAYPDLEVPYLSEFLIWGVVTYAIRHVNPRKLQ